MQGSFPLSFFVIYEKRKWDETLIRTSCQSTFIAKLRPLWKRQGSSIVDLTPPNEYCTRASFVLLDVIMSKHIYFGTCAAAFLCNGRGRKLNKVAFLFTYKLSLVINLRGNFLSQANPYRAKKIPSRALAFQFLSKNYICMYVYKRIFRYIFK